MIKSIAAIQLTFGTIQQSKMLLIMIKTEINLKMFWLDIEYIVKKTMKIRMIKRIGTILGGRKNLMNICLSVQRELGSIYIIIYIYVFFLI